MQAKMFGEVDNGKGLMPWMDRLRDTSVMLNARSSSTAAAAAAAEQQLITSNIGCALARRRRRAVLLRGCGPRINVCRL